MYSKPIKQLISAFSALPSVGERTAERFVFYLLKSGKKEAAELILALKNLMTSIKSCETCWTFTDKSPCHICGDKNRDHTTICVVTEPADVEVMEKTGAFNGVYHILRGEIRADEELDAQNLKIKELLARAGGPVREIILALNPNLEGETTMMFLTKQIKEKNPSVKISRLARGLPMGSDLQYADEITLGSALRNRT
ncbi:MAG: recombination protein RecR [Candidatus Magasanikbacteria bacterium]|nr:recombination protein RecR [Candidatus Magasanikbacteria bacterium]